MLHRQSAGKICPSSRCQKCDIYTLPFKPLRTSVVKPVESPLTQADLSCSVLLFSSQKGIRISVLPISSKAYSLVLGNHWPFQMPRCNRMDITNKRKEEWEIDEWYKQKDLKTSLKKNPKNSWPHAQKIFHHIQVPPYQWAKTKLQDSIHCKDDLRVKLTHLSAW